MINFRYHVVSLTAVFLALAIGLVVGTAALNGPVADTLKDRVDAVSQDNSNLREQVTSYQEEVNREAGVRHRGGAGAGQRQADRPPAAGRRLPTGQDYADQVIAMLTVAGAKVTGRVTIAGQVLRPGEQRRAARTSPTRRPSRPCRPRACR